LISLCQKDCQAGIVLKKTACVDYADDLALTFYTVANALLHHLGNAAKNVGFYVNVLKT